MYQTDMHGLFLMQQKILQQFPIMPKVFRAVDRNDGIADEGERSAEDGKSRKGIPFYRENF